MSGYIGFREWVWRSSTGGIQSVAGIVADHCDFVEPPPRWFFEESQAVYFDTLVAVDRWKFLEEVAGLDLDQLAAKTSTELGQQAKSLRAVALAYLGWRSADDHAKIQVSAIEGGADQALHSAMRSAGYQPNDVFDREFPEPQSVVPSVLHSVRVTMSQLREVDARLSRAIEQEDRRLLEPGPRLYVSHDATNRDFGREPRLRWGPFVSEVHSPAWDRQVFEEHSMNFPLDQRIVEVKEVSHDFIVELVELLEFVSGRPELSLLVTASGH